MIKCTSTLQEQYDYRESQKDFWDINNVIETAEMKGEKKMTPFLLDMVIRGRNPVESHPKADGNH